MASKVQTGERARARTPEAGAALPTPRPWSTDGDDATTICCDGSYGPSPSSQSHETNPAAAGDSGSVGGAPLTCDTAAHGDVRELDWVDPRHKVAAASQLLSPCDSATRASIEDALRSMDPKDRHIMALIAELEEVRSPTPIPPQAARGSPLLSTHDPLNAGKGSQPPCSGRSRRRCPGYAGVLPLAVVTVCPLPANCSCA